jgi:hypothetical protein
MDGGGLDRACITEIGREQEYPGLSLWRRLGVSWKDTFAFEIDYPFTFTEHARIGLGIRTSRFLVCNYLMSRNSAVGDISARVVSRGIFARTGATPQELG